MAMQSPRRKAAASTAASTEQVARRGKRARDEPEAAWTSCLLAVSGSVAAVKAPELAAALIGHGVSVDVVLTEAAFSLLQASYRGAKPWDALQALAKAHAPAEATGEANDHRKTPSSSPPTLRIHRDADEWSNFNAVGADPVLHIELAKRNRLLLVAPLCANTLAAGALGLCSNLLTSVLRDSLGGNCKTVMIATVNPLLAHTDESISTCK